MLNVFDILIFVLTSSLLVTKSAAQGYGGENKQQTEVPKQGYDSSREATEHVPAYQAQTAAQAQGYGSQSQQSSEHRPSGLIGLKAFKYTKPKEEYEAYRPVPDNKSVFGTPATEGYEPTQPHVYPFQTQPPAYHPQTPPIQPPAYPPQTNPPPVYPTSPLYATPGRERYGSGENANPHSTVSKEYLGYTSGEKVETGYRNVQTEQTTMARHLYFTTLTPGYTPGFSPPKNRPNEAPSPIYPAPPPTIGYETRAKSYGADVQRPSINPYQQTITGAPSGQPVRVLPSSDYKIEVKQQESLSTPFHPELGYPFYGDGKFWYYKIPTNQLRNSLPTHSAYQQKETQDKDTYKS